ncbi:glycosyltransferase [Allorhizobium sp. BGMRC 0089]|uniref:glycosyltransferase family 2 protein n=1 Tax=Allorhizobium sonneratiae TaxID=2934936 RepID=UPI0020343F43|nr:glycosyltransferase [Allorhizobium sonneratiae]MCM2293733.1 glycosyltransferase [Allorhizobium sonneratiae]
MPALTLCMPSRRPLAEARASIDSALAFCEARDALLVISDNSGEAEKRAALEQISPRLIWLESQAENAFANMFNAVSAATTPFIMLIGDDDAIVADEGIEAVDLDDIPFDHIGLLPVIETFGPDGQTVATRAFALEDETAAERMFAYLSFVTDNAAFYSIFRREIWLSVMDLFLRHHPTKGAYADWALTLSLFSSGKMGKDDTIRYRYNASRWQTAEQVETMRASLLKEAGLPEMAMHFETLLLFLDVFVLVNRVGSPLSIDERQQLGKHTVNRLLGAFVQKVAETPALYGEDILQLAEMVLDEKDSFTQFQLAMLMAERLQPGLKDKYIAFIQAAISGT